MTTVGFIGSGHIGGTVARLGVAAGYEVLLSNSRGPDTLKELADELGPLAQAATVEQAAAEGDIVVVTIPLRAYRSVPPGPLAGKPVIDTCNYYPQRDGQIAELDSGWLTSSELIQHHLAAAHVVKGFNNIYFQHLLNLSRPAGAGDRPAGTGDRPAGAGERTAGADDRPAGAGDRPAGTGDRPAGAGDRPAGAGERTAGADDRPAGADDRPAGAGDRTFLPIAGDNPPAKAQVEAFLNAIGYGAVDAGELAESWRQEPGTPVYGTPYGPFSDPAGMSADAATIRAALAAAIR